MHNFNHVLLKTLACVKHFISRCTLKSYAYHVSTRKPCIALDSWDIDLFGPPPSVLPNQQHPTANNRPIEIHFFAKVSFSVGNSPDVSSFVIAHVSWFKPHPDRQLIGKPAEVWCNSLYELFGDHSFIPIEYK